MVRAHRVTEVLGAGHLPGQHSLLGTLGLEAGWVPCARLHLALVL